MMRLLSSIPPLHLVVLAVAGVLAGGCAVAAPPPEPAAGPPGITLAPGTLPADAEAGAAERVEAARAWLAAGDLARARAEASEVVESTPQSRHSVDALLLLAEVEREAGESEAALAHADRLARLLPPDDARVARVGVLRAGAAHALGRFAEAVGILLALPPERVTDEADEAERIVRSATGELDREALAAVLRDAPLGSPFAPPVMLAYARLLRLAGDADGAERLAQAALDAGARDADAETARAILDGRALPGEAAGQLAAVLPLTGSPALRAFADGVRAGIEAAAAASSLGDLIEVTVLDDAGEVATIQEQVRRAEAAGAEAILGLLENDALQAAVLARQTSVPLLSPTATVVPDGAAAAYSLGAVDPGAPLALAEWAARVGLDQVVVLHPSLGPAADEARIFIDRLGELGGSVLRTLTYSPGTTSFGEQMQTVQGLQPRALVLTVPAGDVQAIASQAAFHALDTLGVQLMGTAAWGDPGVRASVSTRYTDGVITATPRASFDAEGFTRFVEAYENHFQRTLDDAVAPALGWDAASLLLRVLESGVRGPEAVAAALEDVEGLEGATGVLSVEGGRIVRQHDIFCIQDAGLVPLPEGTRPTLRHRPYPPDPTTGIVPEGPGRPAGFDCTPSAPGAGSPGTLDSHP